MNRQILVQAFFLRLVIENILKWW